jgi:hypothetical protein
MVLEEAKKYGSESQVLELREIGLPLYDPSGAASYEPSSDKNNNHGNILKRITTAMRWLMHLSWHHQIIMALCRAE